ncbi:MAG: serine hydrolase [Bacteriovoracaceae bacterium]
MKDLMKLVEDKLPVSGFDFLAIGVINFTSGKFETIEANLIDSKVVLNNKKDTFFDLASLTKPLTNSLGYFLRKESFTEEMLLCLNHRGGLPAWGLLARDSWKKQILNYPISSSATLYSDFSALRVMLEFNKKLDLKKECQTIWDKETLNWLDLPSGVCTPQYGYRHAQPNIGVVHDPNAFVIHEFCSHAGLFSTIEGLCKTLLNYQNKTGFISEVKSDLAKHSHRFSFGWDRVENPETTLAGKGCGKFTFGHLGFTGTSIWIDPDKMIGHIILSNATKEYWYAKDKLNEIRRIAGELIWNEY